MNTPIKQRVIVYLPVAVKETFEIGKLNVTAIEPDYTTSTLIIRYNTGHSQVFHGFGFHIIDL